MRRYWLLGLAAGLLVPAAAEATVANQSSAKQAYPGKKISCATCHQNPIGRADDLNLYGLDLQKLNPGGAKKLGAAEYLKAGTLDSDGDGVPNGQEIGAGTNPGAK